MKITAYARVGSHGKPYVTVTSPHEACVGRFEIYESRREATRGGGRCVKVTITVPIPRRPKRSA